MFQTFKNADGNLVIVNLALVRNVEQGMNDECILCFDREHRVTIRMAFSRMTELLSADLS